MIKILNFERRLLVTLLVSSLASVGLFLARVASTGSVDYWYLVWNLFLAWPPFVAGWLFVWRWRRLPLTDWGNVGLFALWLGFLPNSFYIVSDLIHLRETGQISLLYDVVMFSSFVWNGFLLGFISLYGMHRAALQRLTARQGYVFVSVVLLLCSFAIYLGRYLRWNSWDVLINPAGLIFDVSERIINPSSHPQTFTTTLMFFVLLASMYAVIYELINLVRQTGKK